MLRTFEEYDKPCGFVVTDAGLAGLQDADRCACEALEVINGCHMCTECGTIYGLVWGWNRMPRRSRYRRKAAS